MWYCVWFILFISSWFSLWLDYGTLNSLLKSYHLTIARSWTMDLKKKKIRDKNFKNRFVGLKKTYFIKTCKNENLWFGFLKENICKEMLWNEFKKKEKNFVQLNIHQNATALCKSVIALRFLESYKNVINYFYSNRSWCAIALCNSAIALHVLDLFRTLNLNHII